MRDIGSDFPWRQREILKNPQTLRDAFLECSSREAAVSLIASIKGCAFSQPWNGINPELIKSRPQIAIACDDSIIQFIVPKNEEFDPDKLYDVYACNQDGQTLIVDLIGRGWDDGTWLSERAEAAKPLTIIVNEFAADLMDGERTVCEFHRNVTPQGIYNIVFGYLRGIEMHYIKR